MKKEVIVQKDPNSQVAEAFRTLRTNIQFMNAKKNIKTILITSGLPSEGKSFVSSNLAVAFAKVGKRVILIDADMRKGRQHNIIGLDNIKGLSNYLSKIDENDAIGPIKLEKYIQPTELSNLSVMTSGNMPPNPSELLSSEETAKLIEELQEKYDYIIFDGTPLLMVADSLILSKQVDITLIVTEYNKTKKDNLEKIKKDIENIGGKIGGVIINKKESEGSQYGYYYGSNTKALI